MSEAMTSFYEFHNNAKGRRVSQVSQTLNFDTETPVSIYLKVRGASDHSFLFESVEGGRSLARYSIVGVDPVATVTILDGIAKATTLRQEGSQFEKVCAAHSDPMDVLRNIISKVSSPGLPGQPRFTGGWVGYFGYDSIRFVEDVPLPEKGSDDLPEVELALFMDVIVIDNVSRTITLISNAFVDDAMQDGTDLRARYEASCERIRNLLVLIRGPLQHDVQTSKKGRLVDHGVEKTSYIEWVEKGKEYIRAGDIFQVVLSRYLTIELDADPLSVYRALRRINPSPYMYFLSLGSVQVIGSSPEMLVRVENGSVETRPIAGTRPRGKDEQEDADTEAELREDSKERAEHLMLVDLARNDLGKICSPGSVHVPDFMSVEKYSHVMHLCSTVSGRLHAGLSPIDALYACFPAGTLSGAPKVRAMQIISELEQCRRGVYGGAVGYIDFSGNLDTCIAIRTIIAQKTSYRLQAGAGIVYDSIPKNELTETIDKMSALLEAMRDAGYEEAKR